ncbi:Y4yA family PLP-dependent enzyme [Thalassospira xiamenensis]|uniref:Diaminopimelate decarboxylase n=1 Tax=Thalassospira xiamenensis TaxID=220697 RepID=A0A285RRK7_9PROT|nr:Y4yA family PLP-dependent enzyme [Thalassospira xiamenensis]SOB96514.1 diaminopimelate decarboxylase [Thalassospira xiamenensis]
MNFLSRDHIEQSGLQPVLSLPPILDPMIGGLLSGQGRRLPDLIGRFGSPLNIVFPHILGQNLARMSDVFNRHAVTPKIFYAAKVNKSHSLVSAAIDLGLGVDVSSRYELHDALSCGCTGEMICASGPAKPRVFHQELIDANALISVDSVEELTDLAELALSRERQKRIRILLRYRPINAHTSRFGIAPEYMQSALRSVVQHSECFAFEGFHFHLGGYAPETRVQAFCEISEWVRFAAELDLAVSMIDIGGGLPVRYVEPDVYAAFLASQDSDHYRNGVVPQSFYPYGGAIDAAEWIDRFLLSPGPGDMTIAQYLRANGITLGLEPGRSLVDQTAISVFRITRVKDLANGTAVLFVEGSSFSACETWFASEFLVDPILISSRVPNHRGSDVASEDGGVRAYVAGHSCLDEDIISNRLISFPSKPQNGDLLVYGNTAGYQMDLLENEFHRVPMPRRISISADLATVQQDDHKGASR